MSSDLWREEEELTQLISPPEQLTVLPWTRAKPPPVSSQSCVMVPSRPRSIEISEELVIHIERQFAVAHAEQAELWLPLELLRWS